MGDCMMVDPQRAGGESPHRLEGREGDREDWEEARASRALTRRGSAAEGLTSGAHRRILI